jgi:hypothetical protein
MALTVIKSTGTDFTANTVAINTLYQGNLPVVCDDISSQFDGDKTVFALTTDQNYINTVTDSKDVRVTINGLQLTPYVSELRWPWITEYASYKGYRVVGANLIIFNAPDPGDTATVTVVSTSQSAQTRRYPYSASSIALGD